MNFWEARQAALAGWEVKKLRSDLVYTALDFSVTSEVYFSTTEMDEEWEIVAGPKKVTSYINIYDCGLFLYPANDGVTKEYTCKGTLEIITDENGKFISARNV